MILSLAWMPGAEIEAEGEASSEEGGRKLRMSFTDNFGNRCKARVIFEKTQVKLELEVTQLVEPRAARQYGTYQLTTRKGKP